MRLIIINVLLGIGLLSFFVTAVGALTLVSMMAYILFWNAEIPETITNTCTDITIISFVVFAIMLAIHDLSNK